MANYFNSAVNCANKIGSSKQQLGSNKAVNGVVTCGVYGELCQGSAGGMLCNGTTCTFKPVSYTHLRAHET